MHVSVFAVLVAVNFFYLLSDQALATKSQKQAEILVPEVSGGRKPASLPEPSSDVLSLNSLCDFKGLEKSQTGLEFVELGGTNCLKNKKILKLKISNETNGYVASIFELDKEKFKTDLIRLNLGANKISISGFDSQNNKFITYVNIHRQ